MIIKGTYRRIEFRDYTLSQKVRTSMQYAIMRFDNDHNALFDEQQITQALVTILKEDPNQIRYFIKNVFRYDTDNDGKITPEEFVLFCLEQHFGEMAIQRLHKKGYYSSGSKRIMNLEEFQNTMNSCLGSINAKGTHQQYEVIFNDVDSDKDGYITYQEYFMFLKQYFGSQRGPVDPPPKQPDQKQPQKPVDPQFSDGNGETPQQRFAKLIYSQLKIQVMDRDRNKNLSLERIQIEDILMNVFKLSFTDQTQAQDRVLNNADAIKYEQFMKKVVVFYICEVDPRKNLFATQLNEQDFIENALRATNFVEIRPAKHILQKCFNRADASRAGSISKNTYINFMRNIFESHTFDNRGLTKKSSIHHQYY